MEEKLRVGQVSERTGLSVRTLHHYDEIGLLRPGERTASGHRLYGPAELARLQHIRSLKQLGFSLAETAACLDDPRFSLEETLRLHRERLDGHLERVATLRERLVRLEGLARHGDMTTDALLATLHETTMIETYYTKEQLERLAERRAEIGEEKIVAVEEHWFDLAARVQAAMEEGLGPEDDDVAALAREWRGLTAETVAGFTGGDRELTGSLRRMWTEEPEAGTRWGMSPEVRRYIGAAIAALDR